MAVSALRVRSAARDGRGLPSHINEQLEDDFIKLLSQCGVQLSDAQIATIRGSKKTNTSSRKRSIEYYYDRDTLELVKHRDQFISEKYGYATPDL